ncbi:MAG: DNA sulfur modification protein DndD [Deltaproteobacteria bacterium]|nr:DNA sulfur modification protein DndD [Deltaproteobacteria bacterium]
MIVEQLVLQNFGVYGGRQVIDLAPPSRQRPITLFGGYNGGGKTTLLDALQLAMYGKLARCSNRGDLAYDDFLRRSIHWGADATDGAALELQIRRVIEGRSHVFRVHRSWGVRAGGVRERVEVFRNGEFDSVLTEQWGEQVDELLPVRLSNFFFFDGEKIEALADLGRSTEVLTTAISSLLGLDLVDQLAVDLTVLERRKRAEQKGGDSERAAVDAAKAEIDRLAARRADLTVDRAAAQNALDFAEKKLREAEERYRLSGGDAYERRVELEAARKACIEQLQRAEEQLRELAAEAAPLLMVRNALGIVASQADAEEKANVTKSLLDVLAERDKGTLAAARKAKPPKALLEELERFLAADRKQRTAASRKLGPGVGLSAEGREELKLLRSMLETEVPASVRKVLKQHDELQAKLAKLDRKLASAPDRDAINRLFEARNSGIEGAARAQQKLNAIDAELQQVTREHDAKWSSFARTMQDVVHEGFEREATSRIISHSGTVRQSLQQFRGTVVQRHVRRIEALVLESFRQLLRKQALVSDLKIDPVTFVLSLYGVDGRQLSPERLSAGERQLLAVSIIWGLARASGRSLPAVIDTPLGRLDSHHRSHLVQRYFPFASHQVLLLSTDEEIDERYYEKLKPAIGRSYHLASDAKTGVTRIESGYFW